MDSRTAIVNGIRMRWEEVGTGPPVVFLHGIPTSPRLWRDVTPLVRGARSLAWEMVGYGGSIAEGEGRDISVAQQAEYLVAWMQATEIDRAVLVGHDLGGGVAQIAAVQHPERVAGLVLINSIGYGSWPIPSVAALRAAAAAVEHLPGPALRAILTMFWYRGHEERAAARQAIGQHWPYYAAADGAAAFARQLRSLDVNDTLAVADRLPQLRLPARLVWGAADQFQKIGYGYRLAHDLRAPLDRVEGGKHFVPEDHPERVAASVNALTEELGRPA